MYKTFASVSWTVHCGRDCGVHVARWRDIKPLRSGSCSLQGTAS